MNHCQFRALLEEENSEYEDVPFHTEECWLSHGKVFHRFYEMREDIASFMTAKGLALPELADEM